MTLSILHMSWTNCKIAHSDIQENAEKESMESCVNNINALNQVM